MLSASQATFHPNQCHLCSCLLIYMLDSAGEMKSAANKSYSSALAKALLGAGITQKCQGLYSKTRLLGITSWNGHLTVKWHSCCRGVGWKHSHRTVTKWEQDKQGELSCPCISNLSSQRAEILAPCPLCWASPTMLFSRATAHSQCYSSSG